MAKITFYIPDQSAAMYDISEEDEVTIGRSADCDIILDHSSVSGQHASIRKIGAGLHVLVDNGSTNGIFLEGEQVSEAPLSNGASFTIGSVPADFEGEQSAEAQPAASAATSEPGGTADGSIIAVIAESSSRPNGFKDMSPVKAVEKKDQVRQIALILGAVAIVTSIALALFTVMMKVT